jgi:hypothetical protein
MVQNFCKVGFRQVLVAVRNKQGMHVRQAPCPEFGTCLCLKFARAEQNRRLSQVLKLYRVADTPRGAAASSRQSGNHEIVIRAQGLQHRFRRATAVALFGVGVNHPNWQDLL